MRPLVLALLVAAGCHAKSKCTPGTRGSVELRDGAGGLTLALKDDAVCDSHNQQVATLTTKPDGVTLKDLAGNVRLDFTRETPQVAQVRDREGPHLRLYRDARELRVLRADGVPLGSVVPEPSGATIFNQASAPIGRVSLRDRDAVVLDMAGTALSYIIPGSAGPGPAGVFGVPSLEPVDQLAIYMYWSR